MDKMLNNSNRLDQPDNDPFAPTTRETTGLGSVYETINDYQEAKKNTMFSQQQQDYRWKLQQLEMVESEREALEDSTYQVMSSASVGDAPDSAGGVAATSRFSYPQPYPYSPQSPNDPNPAIMVSMPQQPLAASVHVPDAANMDPLDYDHITGYQFRPCPASAAAGSTLSPIREDRYDNDAGVCGQFHHPHVFHHNEAAMEGEPDLSMEEGEQDYTFMSQAGTLASQTSTNGSTAPFQLSYDDDCQVSLDTTPSNTAVKIDKNGTQMAQYKSISQC
jgi:hypothetical protein